MRTHMFRRGLCLALILAWTAVLPIHAAPAQEPFSDLRIAASAMDFPQETVSIHIYRLDGTGSFQMADSVLHPCTLNRVTGDASFYIQPTQDGVWVTVDYLTDLNGDGIYEMLDCQDAAVQWPLAPSSSSGSVLQPVQTVQPLTKDETYVLTASCLVEGGHVANLSRTGGGPYSLDAGDASSHQDRPLYLVSLHHTADDGQEEIQSYYLKIYDRVLIPDDVSPSDPCYDAVEFCLAEGYLSGTGDGTFSPDATIDRAQLAQILWRMGGSLSADQVRFSDVGPSDWYCQAVSWCCRTGVMTGASADTFGAGSDLSREQLALIFYQYASRSLPEMSSASHTLDRFSDANSVSPWAKTGVEWAVANGLLSGYEDGTLRPGAGVTRASMAQVLYTYSQLAAKR